MDCMSGHTAEGVEIFCSIDPEIPQALVEYDGDPYIRFLFNPDFPQDAKNFFVALCQVKEVKVDD